MGSLLQINVTRNTILKRAYALRFRLTTSSSPGKACCQDLADWHDYPYELGTDSCSGSSGPHDGSDQPGIDLVSYRFLLFVYFNIEVLRNQIFFFPSSICQRQRVTPKKFLAFLGKKRFFIFCKIVFLAHFSHFFQIIHIFAEFPKHPTPRFAHSALLKRLLFMSFQQ